MDDEDQLTWIEERIRLYSEWIEELVRLREVVINKIEAERGFGEDKE